MTKVINLHAAYLFVVSGFRGSHPVRSSTCLLMYGFGVNVTFDTQTGALTHFCGHKNRPLFTTKIPYPPTAQSILSKI